MKAYSTCAAWLLTTACIISASPAYAVDGRDVVRSDLQKAVLSSNGNCVRTQWTTGNDLCAPPEQKVTKTEYKEHIPLSQEERTVYFGFNQAVLSEESQQKLSTLSANLKNATDVKEARIVGYADRVGSTSYNEKLSQKRAQAVQSYIVSHGYANARVTETRWLGEQYPVSNCAENLPRPQMIACLQKDRRVEVEIDYLPEGIKAGQR